MDTARFLANYTNIITARQIHRIIKENLKDWLHNLVCTAAAGMEEEIKLRKVSFDPIKTSARLDGNSGKVRDIGVECIKQQIYDYVATNGLREALESRDGEKWRTVTSYLLTAILGIAVGIIAKQFGL